MNLIEYFDFVYIDLEHGFRSVNELVTILSFYNSINFNYSVRIRSIHDPLIQTLIDNGVRNFIVPQLRSLEEFRTFKRKIELPPKGVRGIHPRSQFKRSAPANENLKLTIIIETLESLKLIENFANDDLVESLYLGVFDLSMELEMEGSHYSKELNEYFGRVSNICYKYDKQFIAMLPDGEDILFAEKHNLNRIVAGIDSILIHDFYRKLTSNLMKY
jgi:2-keto-3-deoxy-L-rhamnonate aldolase RhmA